MGRRVQDGGRGAGGPCGEKIVRLPAAVVASRSAVRGPGQMRFGTAPLASRGSQKHARPLRRAGRAVEARGFEYCHPPGASVAMRCHPSRYRGKAIAGTAASDRGTPYPDVERGHNRGTVIGRESLSDSRSGTLGQNGQNGQNPTHGWFTGQKRRVVGQ